MSSGGFGGKLSFKWEAGGCSLALSLMVGGVLAAVILVGTTQEDKFAHTVEG